MIKITDENKDIIINACLTEAAKAILNDLSSQAEKLKSQIDFLESKGVSAAEGQLEYLKKQYEKLKEEERFQKYLDEHEDEFFPQPQKSKDGKIKYVFTGHVDGANVSVNNSLRYTYATSPEKARDNIARRIRNAYGNNNISISVQDIEEVMDNS